MPLLSDIREFKASAGISPENTREDKKILFCLEWASEWIEEHLNRGLALKSRTEYYDGTGAQTIQLKARPVYTTPAIAVSVDEAGFYGSSSGSFASNTALTYGTDFCVKIDQENNRSRSGLLLRINNVWPRPSVRQKGLLAPFLGRSMGNVKVTYTAGYTVDDMPSQIRLACNILANRIRYILPLGMELGSESYEERHITLVTRQKDYLMGFVKPFLFNFRNWKF